VLHKPRAGFHAQENELSHSPQAGDEKDLSRTTKILLH